jgi:hypothetical protein
MEQNKKIPVGIILFLIYTGFIIFSTIIDIFESGNTLIIGTLVFSGLVPFIYSFLIILGNTVIFYGTIKRKKWAQMIILIFYPVSMIIPLISFIAYFLNKEAFINALSSTMQKSINMTALETPLESMITPIIIFGIIFEIIITIVVIILVIKKKDYFSE